MTKVLAPVRPNLGLEIAYRQKLVALVDAMQEDLTKKLLGTYKANEPEMAADMSPAMELRRAMRKLKRKWQRRFDDASDELAEYFATAATDRADGALEHILRKAGFTVRFKLTPAMNDAYQATIGENVGLIRSIASEHLTQVEGHVMRAVQAGHDLHTLSNELQAQFGVTKDRAAFIARDQSSKAVAVTTRVRQTEMGLKTAVWLHSSAGKHPRPSHVAMSGKVYDVSKGAYLEGKWTWPGVEINCRCVSRIVIPGLT